MRANGWKGDGEIRAYRYLFSRTSTLKASFLHNHSPLSPARPAHFSPLLIRSPPPRPPFPTQDLEVRGQEGALRVAELDVSASEVCGCPRTPTHKHVAPPRLTWSPHLDTSMCAGRSHCGCWRQNNSQPAGDLLCPSAGISHSTHSSTARVEYCSLSLS